MRKILLFVVLPVLMLGMSACSGNEVDKKLEKAAECIEKGDYEMAQAYCDVLYSEQWNNLTVENKCNLAICYLSLAGEYNINEDSNMAAMRKCYEAVMKENSKDAKAYLTSIIDEETDVNMYDALELVIGLDDMGKELGDEDY